MEQTLFFVFAAVIVFALLYRWKKRTEKKMGNDLPTVAHCLIGASRSCFVFVPME